MKLKPMQSLIVGMGFAAAMALTPAQAQRTGPGMHGGMMGPGMHGGMMGHGMHGGMMGPGMHGGMMGHGMHHGMMYGQGMMGPLDLDEAQQKKLAKLQQSQAKQQWQLMQQLAQQRNELARLSNAENPDTQAISGAYDKVANLQKQMFMNNLETQKQFRELLTDEQRNTLKEMRQMGWDNW